MVQQNDHNEGSDRQTRIENRQSIWREQNCVALPSDGESPVSGHPDYAQKSRGWEKDRWEEQKNASPAKGHSDLSQLSPIRPKPQKRKRNPGECEASRKSSIDRVRCKCPISLTTPVFLKQNLIQQIRSNSKTQQESEEQKLRRLPMPNADKKEREEDRRHRYKRLQ